MRLFAALALIAVSLCQGALLPDEVEQGWIELFDGATLFGWSRDIAANWIVAKTGGIRFSPGEANGPLRTTSSFGDFEMTLRFRSESDIQASVRLRCGAADICGASIPLSRTNSDWHLLVIHAEGRNIWGKIDNKFVEFEPPGALTCGMIELHSDSGTAIEFGSIKLRPINLRPVKKWTLLPETLGFFSIRVDGGIHVEGGPGELETQDQFGDFVLQFEAEIHTLTNTPEVRGGFFVRGTPRERWSGWKIALDNRFKDKDRTKPVEFGTGGIFGKQPVRRINSADRRPTAITVVANGSHFATWINGYQEIDWNAPVGGNIAGTLGLQALDATTNFDFRKVRIQELK